MHAWNGKRLNWNACTWQSAATKQLSTNRNFSGWLNGRRGNRSSASCSPVGKTATMLDRSYAWQHFKAIEYGYKISELKVQRDNLVEMNRALRLEEASLRDPERIDKLARNMGLVSPQPGQVIRMDTVLPDAGAPIMASAAPISVVSAR